jgi:tetratricopeptide (TPR) repeat protein
MKNGEPKKGIDYYNIAMNNSNLKDISFSRYYSRGQAHYQLGEYDEALDDFFTFI